VESRVPNNCMPSYRAGDLTVKKVMFISQHFVRGYNKKVTLTIGVLEAALTAKIS